MQKQSVRLCGGLHYGRHHRATLWQPFHEPQLNHKAKRHRGPTTLAKRARVPESDAKRTASIKSNTATTSSGPICRAVVSPISAMSVAKITATKGGAGRGLNLEDPKRPAPEAQIDLNIHRPLSRTTHRREKPNCEVAVKLDPSSPGQYMSR
jgi:hypothetical protein